MFQRIFIIFSLLISSTVALAADDKKALVGGRLIDGFGGHPLANSVILINGDTIERIGTVGSLPVPKGYKVISTEGMDVLPGLWENHAHLKLTGHADYEYWDKVYPDRLVDEIMPASAVQLLLAGITSARDLGAQLEDSITIKNQINNGEIPGPNLYVTGPFLQHRPYARPEPDRWGIYGVDDAVKKVTQLADAGVDLIKLIDQDNMTLEEAKAIVDTAHARGLKVIGHSHRPNEIRRGLKIGIDNYEHTGLTTAPEYPADIIEALKERTATGRIAGGPLFWTPTVDVLNSYMDTVNNAEHLDSMCWKRGLKADTIADITQSIKEPGQLAYMQLTGIRMPTLKRKFQQLKNAGVVMLIGTDSGVPMNFHCQSTWREMDTWVNVMDVDPMDTIRAATYWPAVMMGVQDKFGTVSKGKKADIIAVKGNVLKHMNILGDVKLVMKGGVIYKENGDPVEANLKSK